MILETRDLTKTYHRPGSEAEPVHALRGVSLTIPRGQFTSVMGPSGSGKSTLLHLIGGLDRPSSGSVRVDGQALEAFTDPELSAFRRRKLGFIFQFFNLLPTLTALENVALPRLLDGAPLSQVTPRAKELLDQMGLRARADHRPDQLSGGEMQRVAIARALVAEPLLILADEPTGNLDSKTGDAVLELLSDLARTRGHTIVMVTHDARAASYGDRLIRLRDGRVESDGAPPARSSFTNASREGTTPELPVLNLFRFVGLRHLRLRPARTTLTVLGVAFGIALYVAIAIINRSTLASFRESVDAVAGKATLIVSAGEAGFDEARLDAIKAVPGVAHAAPMIETQAYFTGDRNASETLAILGVDLLQESAVRTYKTTDEQVIDDPLVFLNQPDSIIVTHSFAKAHGLKNDSTLELATAQGKKRFTVRGLLSPEGPAKAYGGDVAIMDIDGARVTFGKEGKIDRADLITAEGTDIDAVAARVRAALGPGYQVERPASRSESMERVIASYQALLTVFSTLALIVGLFLVTNSVSISVAERRREIGTLRALGATRSGILALFLSEACGTGFLGAVLGAWLGRGLASLMVGLVTQSMSDQYLTRIEVKHLIFGAREVLMAAAVGTVAAFVAALVPAYRATRIGPLDAMRKVRSQEEERGSRLARLAPWAGLAGLVFFAISSLNHLASRAPALGWIDHVCSMVGAALVGPAIVAAMIRWLAPHAIPAGGTILRLATDNLLRSPRRTGSNVMTLMVGLILVTMIGTVNVSFRETIMSWFDGLFTADVLVSSVGKVISFETQPISEEFGAKLSALPGVQGGAFAFRYVQIDYGGKKIGVKAVDAPAPGRGYGNLPTRDRPASKVGPEFYGSPDPVVLVSRNFVLHFGKKTGDVLELDTPSGRVAFRILAQIEDFASPEGVFYIPRSTYKKVWRDNLVTAFMLFAKPGYDAQGLRSEVDQAFGRSHNLMAVSNAEFRDQMEGIIDQSFTYTQAIKLAALLVGLLGLFNTFLISVMERTRELGVLRAVGMSRAQLARMVVFEALIQGGLGAAAAVALGTYLSYLWILGSLAHVLGWIIDFHFPWAAASATIGAGILVTALAAAFPAARAANLVIREALEYE